MAERCAIHPDRAAEVTCARCGDFACYECVGASPERVCARCRLRAGTGPRTEQVRWLGISMISNGALIVLASLFYVMMAIVMSFLPQERPDDPPGWVMGVIFGVFALLHAVPGILQVLAGVQVLRYRGRVFAFVALSSGFLTMMGCYCMPLSVAVAVWGFILLNDMGVRTAFEQTEQPQY